MTFQHQLRAGNTTHHHDNNIYVLEVNCFSLIIIYAWLLSSKMVSGRH
jgi:hypothetical protein